MVGSPAPRSRKLRLFLVPWNEARISLPSGCSRPSKATSQFNLPTSHRNTVCVVPLSNSSCAPRHGTRGYRAPNATMRWPRPDAPAPTVGPAPWMDWTRLARSGRLAPVTPGWEQRGSMLVKTGGQRS